MKKRIISFLLTVVMVVGVMPMPVKAETEGIETIQTGGWIKVSLNHMEEKKVLITPDESGEYIFYMPGGEVGYDEESGAFYDLVQCSLYVEDDNGNIISESFEHQANKGVYSKLEAGEQYTLIAKNDQYYSSAISGTIYMIKSEPAESIQIEGLPYSAVVGESLYAYAVTCPDVSSERSLTWESSDDSIIALEYVYPFRCYFICKGAGTATITAKTDNGVSGSVTLEVIDTDATEDYSCGENLTWCYDEETQTLTISGVGDMYDETYTGTSMACTFNNNNVLRANVQTIVIEEGVTSVGDRAFLDFSNVTNVQIADSVTSIGIAAFPYGGWGNWSDVEISKNVLDIGWCAFRGDVSVWVADDNPNYCSDEMGSLYNKSKTELLHVSGKVQGKYMIQDTVKTIGDQAFLCCGKLTDVEIPSSVEKLGDYVFGGCSNLTGIWVSEQNPNYASDSRGVLFNKSMTKLLIAPDGLTGSYTVPVTVNEISYSAFEDCDQLTRVILCDGITKLNYGTFNWCRLLKEVNIPRSVSEIDFCVFGFCDSLEKIIFEGNAPVFSAEAFYDVTTMAYYPAGNPTWTEDILQNYGGSITWVAYSEPEIEQFEINLAQVELGNALNLYFLFPAASCDDWTGCYAEVTKTYADGRDNVVITVPADQWEDKPSGGKQYKRIGFHNISAKEMADEISIVVYNADGVAISNQHSDSIVSYLERMLGKNSNAEFRTLAVDMLNYGAAAQTQFKYNLDNLANANIGDYQQYATATDAVCVNNQVKGDNVRGTSVSLENNIVMNVYFTNQTADMTAEVTFKNHAGTDMTVVLTSVDTSNGYCFQIDKLAVADMRTLVTITCKDADGNVYGTLTDSVEGYVARTGLTKAINQAIMKFSDSAYAYLH